MQFQPLLPYLNRYEQYIGPLPPLPLPAFETHGEEPEAPQPHMQIRDLLAVKPETNAVCTTTRTLKI